MTTQSFSFANFTIPNDCKRLFITAPLQPSNGDPRIQPTGFPDIGPVLYPDPKGEHGQICLLDSEAAVANKLEETCLDNKYEGTLVGQNDPNGGLLYALPYLRVEKTDGEFVTASTIDGHRFASEHILNATGDFEFPTGVKKEIKRVPLYEWVKYYLSASNDGDTVPPANVPRIFELVCEVDPLSLVHGFQISLKKKLTFVGLRSPRALLGSVVALGVELVSVPGIKFEPIKTGDVPQAIFRKERITAARTEARFTIDLGLINSMPLSSDEPTCQARRTLLIALSVWKVARLIGLFAGGHRLRTECDLTLDGAPKFRVKPADKDTCDFDYESIAAASLKDLISAARLPTAASPKILEFNG